MSWLWQSLLLDGQTFHKCRFNHISTRCITNLTMGKPSFCVTPNTLYTHATLSFYLHFPTSYFTVCYCLHFNACYSSFSYLLERSVYILLFTTHNYLDFTGMLLFNIYWLLLNIFSACNYLNFITCNCLHSTSYCLLLTTC